MLKINTFGGLQITRDGEPVTGFASRKAEALLVYLACTARAHPRERLADLLWDGRTQRQSMANLRVVLSSLRKQAGPFITITRDVAGVDPDAAVWLDVSAMESALAPVSAAVDSPETAGKVKEALALYLGEFLEGFHLREARGIETWIVTERERLHRLAIAAWQQLGAWHLAQDEHAAAVAASTRLLEFDPLAEAGHRQLMEALARSGRRSEALAQYRRCRRLLMDELSVEPAPATIALYEAIQEGEISGEPAAFGEAGAPDVPSHNLPPNFTPFVGREQELEELDALISDPAVRLVTIIGPGGIGKTRLALAAAEKQLSAPEPPGSAPHHFPHGVYFASLAPLNAPSELTATLAASLDFQLHQGGRPAQKQLLDYLSEKRLLLVLDNFEHLLGAAPLLVTLLETAPGVKIMATSRERLRLRHEHRYPIEGFAVDEWETVEQALDNAAVRLFVRAAQQVQPHFELTSGDLPHLARLCRLAGGMPLALELAASWADVLSPADLAAELQEGLGILETDLQDVPDRHRSMRATFDVSWQRLDPAARAVFARLSVFRGGFSRAAAQEVAAATLSDLAALSGKSFLRYDRERSRYYLHELLRQYAYTHLATDAAAEAQARDRHAAFYCDQLAGLDGEWHRSGQLKALEKVDRDAENVLEAWRWAVGQKQVTQLARVLYSFCTYLEWRGRYEDAITFLRAATTALKLKTVGASPQVSQLLARILSWRSFFVDDYETATRLRQEASACLEQPELVQEDVRYERAFLHWVQGLTQMEKDVSQARPHLKESIKLYRALGDDHREALALKSLGVSAWHVGDYEVAEKLLGQALSTHEAFGDRRQIASTLITRGLIHKHLGRLRDAESDHRDSLALFRELGDRHGTWHAHWTLGRTLNWAGRFEEALAISTESLEGAEVLGQPSSIASALVGKAIDNQHLGRYREAIALARRASETSTSITARQWLGFATAYRGAVILAEGKPEEAVSLLQQAATILQDYGKGIWAGPLAVLALAARKLGRVDMVRQALGDVLLSSAEIRAMQPALEALPAAALLLADAGRLERAVEIYALAWRHPYVANSRWFQDVAGRELDALAANLAPAVRNEAHASGRELDLWQTTTQLLAWLDET